MTVIRSHHTFMTFSSFSTVGRDHRYLCKSVQGALLVPLILILLFIIGLTDSKQAAAQGQPITYSNSIISLDRLKWQSMGLHVAAVEPVDLTQTMELHFWLKTPNIEELKARVAKGELISPDEMKNKYFGSSSNYDELITWLKQQGLEITGTTPDRTSVYATGTLDQIQKSLQVQMVNVTYQGVTYAAAKTPPILPANIGATVTGIDGLQPFLRANRHVIFFNAPAGQASIHHTGVAAAAVGFMPNVANQAPYLVHEVLKAYGADGLAVTGAGQKIAILIDTLPVDTDLQAFWKRNGLSTSLSQVEKINVTGQQQLPPQEGEETLDVEWSTGVAPGATVRVYAAGSLQFLALDKALDRITSDLQTEPNIHQLSISLGLGETFMNKDEVDAEDTRFARLAALGVNTFVSSGDAGSNPDDTGQSSSGPLQVEFQSSDPFLTAVGGTSLTLDPGTGNIANETAWSDSGGGVSQFFTRPVWQAGIHASPVNKRLVPDVSSAADPNNGALIVFRNQERRIGGTSWSAPTWAGFCALINEARAKEGKSQLPFMNPLIYPLASTDAFRDIKVGNNGQYDALPGYDLVTGMGVPNVKQLLQALQ